MAGTKQLLVKVAGDISGARNAFTTLGGDADNLGHRLSSIGDRMTVGVTLPIVAGFTAATAAAATDAQEQAVLQHALEQNVGATDTLVASTEDWITSMQMATGVSDTQLRVAMTELVNKGSSVVESQTMIQAALDLAAGAGVGFEAAITALAKAADGNVTALSRMGIEVKNADGSARSLDEILVQVSETMGGSAAAAADTAAGRMAIAQQRFGEAAETLGTALIPAMELLSGAISTVSQWFENLGSGGQHAVIIFAAVAAAIGPILSITTRLITSGLQLTNWFMGLSNVGYTAVAALTAVAVGIGIVFATIARERAQGQQAIDGFRATITGLGEEEGRFAAIQSLLSTGTYDLATASAIVASAYGDELTPAQRDLIATSWDHVMVAGELQTALGLENTALAENTALLSGAKIEAGAAAGAYDTLAGSLMKGTGDLETRWTPAVASAAGATRDLAGAQGDLQGKVSAATEAIETQQQTFQEQVDPALNFAARVEDAAAAEEHLRQAAEDYGRNSPEYAAALRDVASANAQVLDAAQRYNADPSSRDAFGRLSGDAAAAAQQIKTAAGNVDELRAKMDTLRAAAPVTVKIILDTQMTGAGSSYLNGRIGGPS